MRTVQCSCGREMAFLKREKIQLGQTGFFAGDWPNIMAGALETEIYCCPRCGKIEFYRPDDIVMEPEDGEDLEIGALPPESGQQIVGVSRDGVPQVWCPECGKTHDFDYPRCPFCGK